MVVNNIKMVINYTLVAKQILLAIAKLVIKTRIMVVIFLELVVNHHPVGRKCVSLLLLTTEPIKTTNDHIYCRPSGATRGPNG